MVKKVKKTKKTIDDKKRKVVTPPGFLSFPYLLEPDTGRQYSDDKFHVDFFMSAEDFKNHPDGKKLRQAVLEVGREHFGDDDLELSDFTHPFNKIKDNDNDRLNNCIKIRPKSDFAPTVCGPDKEPLSEKQIRAIKGGDYARLVVVVYPYTHGDGGVTLGLNLVQYQQPGEALGSGAAADLAMIDEMEVEMEDVEEEEEEDEEVESRLSKKLKKKPITKPNLDEDDEDEDDLGGDDKFEEDFDDDEPEEDEDEEEEEEEEPVKKKSKKQYRKEDADAWEEDSEPVKKKSKKAGRPKKKASDDDDDFD